MGFSLVAKHRSKDVLLYRQGQINFIVNREPKSQAAYFAAEHGPSACGLAFRVHDAHQAYHRALALGAQPIEIPTGPMELRLPAIKGIGGAPLYLIDRYEDGKSIYFFDPNGHRLELAADCGTPEMMAKLGAVKRDMLEEWSRTRQAPKHAAWMHDGSHT